MRHWIMSVILLLPMNIWYCYDCSQQFFWNCMSSSYSRKIAVSDTLSSEVQTYFMTFKAEKYNIHAVSLPQKFHILVCRTELLGIEMH